VLTAHHLSVREACTGSRPLGPARSMSPLQLPASQTLRDIRRGPDSRISVRSRVASAPDRHLVRVEPEPRQRLHQLLFLIREVRQEGVAQVIDEFPSTPLQPSGFSPEHRGPPASLQRFMSPLQRLCRRPCIATPSCVGPLLPRCALLRSGLRAAAVTRPNGRPVFSIVSQYLCMPRSISEPLVLTLRQVKP
jgi:hypothetical protein